ncbi:MAG: nicotinate-nucleotide adenylyltransferase [Kiritimatiellia bacterium]
MIFPLPRSRIALLGGSFDPVHNGHLALATAAWQTGKYDAVWFVPAASSPFKIGRMNASAEDRIAMLHLAIQDNPAFDICLEDISHKCISYTIDLVSRLCSLHPEVRFTFLIGGDSLQTLSKWKNADTLVKCCDFESFGRSGAPLDARRLGFDPQTNRRLLQNYHPEFDYSVSSTQIRNAIAAHAAIDGLVPPAVANYIRAHHLYSA